MQTALKVSIAALIFAIGMSASGEDITYLWRRPAPSDRTSLAVACASRHIGLALLIAANARGPKATSNIVRTSATGQPLSPESDSFLPDGRTAGHGNRRTPDRLRAATLAG